MRTLTEMVRDVKDDFTELTPSDSINGADTLAIEWIYNPSDDKDRDYTPSGIAGNKKYVSDLVRCDDSLRQLIAEKKIKGVTKVHPHTDEELSTRYIVPLRKGEILVLYEHPHPLPQGVLYNDDETHQFIAYYYRNGREVPLCEDDYV